MADLWQQAVDWARSQNTHWEGIARDLNNRENLGYSESGTVVNLDVLKHAIASAGNTLETGEGKARVIGAANEIYAAYRGRDGTNEHVKDLYNNEVGYAVADFLENNLDREATVEDILNTMPTVVESGILHDLAGGSKGNVGIWNATIVSIMWELGPRYAARIAINQVLEANKDAIFARIGETPNDHCFLGDTPIQMWPLDPMIKPRADGSYDEAFVLSKVWEKPISEIKVGDIVVAYDDKGRLGPKRVLRTMENRATHILDFWGTGVTPGHAYFCADGPNKGGHAPIMDILRMDGALMRADGTTYRAATNYDVGSMGDMMIHASATLQKPDGTWTEPKQGKVRFGTRIILPDGRHMSFMEMAASEGWRVSDDGYMVGMIKGENGEPQEQKFLFPYAYGEDLPKPEAYILARSKVTLEAIYAAGEWEQIGTRMPAPAGMVGLNTNHTSTLLQPSKPEPNIPPAFANHPDAPRRSEGRSMNRKQRKAMEAKQRKAGKARKRLVS